MNVVSLDTPHETVQHMITAIVKENDTTMFVFWKILSNLPSIEYAFALEFPRITVTGYSYKNLELFYTHDGPTGGKYLIQFEKDRDKTRLMMVKGIVMCE